MSILFSDDFNRADGTTGANWTNLGSALFNIVSNQAAPNSGNTSDYWNGGSPAANGWVQLTAVTRPASPDSIAISPMLNVSTFDGYYFGIDTAGATLFRLDASVPAAIGAAFSSPSNGTVVRVERRDGTWSIYYNDALQGTRSDNTYTTSQRAILGGSNTSARVDDFSTGNLPTISSATPSGTLSNPVVATIGCTTDDSTGTLYIVVDTASLSGITASQIKAGQNASSAAAVASRSAAVSSSTPSAVAAGLTKNTTYNYAILQFSGGNSNILTGSFTTADLNTFGLTTPGTSSSLTQDGRYWASKFTLTEDADLALATVFFDFDAGNSSAAGDSAKVVIYEDSGGSPGALAAVSSATAVPANDVAVDFSISGTLAAGTYWLGAVNNGFNSRIAGTASGGEYVRKQDLTYASPADPMGTPDAQTTGSGNFAVFVSYSPARAPRLAFTGGKILSVAGGKLLRIA